MRKITANYIFPVSSAPLKNGILVLDNENRIVEIIDTKNNFKEIENLEFYGGVIVPGFVDTFALLAWGNFSQADISACIGSKFNDQLKANLAKKTPDLQSVQKAINHLEAFGTKGAADIFPIPESENAKNKSKIQFSDLNISENFLMSGFEEPNEKSITLVNRYSLKNRPNLEKHFAHCCIGTGSLGTHQKLSVFEEMKWIQTKYPGLPVWELIKWASINPAKKLNLFSELGSLEVGKKPGLNLISGIDFPNNRLSKQSELKVIL